MKEIIEILKNPRKYKAIVIGDIILDRYYFGDAERISPEAPVPIVHIKRIDNRLGGASNTALNLKNLGVDVDIMGVLGNDIYSMEIGQLFQKFKFRNDFLFIDEKRPTVVKIRVIARNQQVLRIDFEETSRIENDLKMKVLSTLKDILSTYDIVIVSDYNKGFLDEEITQFIIEKSRSVIIDPKGKYWHKYKNADFITPNVKEVSEGLGIDFKNEDKDLEKAGMMVIKNFHIKNVLITRSEKGLTFINQEKILHLPTDASEVYDVSGAGDTVVAVLAFGILNNLKIEDIMKLCNLSASIVIKHIGTYAITVEDLLRALKF